jgi:hypothetical protein
MEGSVFTEIRTDHVDMNGVVHMDGYRSPDENAEGEVICFIVKGEPYWRDPEFQFDPYVKEMLAEVQTEAKVSLDEKKAKIVEAVTFTVYDRDAKPRPEFTNGSPLERKLEIINESVTKIVELL